MDTVPPDLSAGTPNTRLPATMDKLASSSVGKQCRATCMCYVSPLLPTSLHWLAMIAEASQSSRYVLTLTVTADLARPPSVLWTAAPHLSWAGIVWAHHRVLQLAALRGHSHEQCSFATWQT